MNKNILELKTFSEDKKTPISNTCISVLKNLCLKASQSTEMNSEQGVHRPWNLVQHFTQGQR